MRQGRRDSRHPTQHHGAGSSISLAYRTAAEGTRVALWTPVACRPTRASPCSSDVRRHRRRCRGDPRRLRAARRVVGRGRVAQAVPRHHRRRAGAGVGPDHRQLEAAAAAAGEAYAEAAPVTADALRRPLLRRQPAPAAAKFRSASDHPADQSPASPAGRARAVPAQSRTPPPGAGVFIIASRIASRMHQA